MHLLPEGSFDLGSVHCHLHTSRQRADEIQTFKTIDVIVDGGSFETVKETFASPEELIQTAWALLLRRYLGNDTVSFLVFGKSQDDRCMEHNVMPKNLVDDTEIRILQYDISLGRHLRDICPTSFSVSAKQISENKIVNTALVLSSLQFQASLQKTGNHLFPNTKHEILTSNVSYFQNLPLKRFRV